MNIAIITDSIEYKSGSRSQIELAKILSKENRITLIGNSKGSQKKLISDLNRASISSISIPNLPSWVKTYKYLSYFNKSGYDLILSSATLSLFLAAALSKVPLISIYHGSQWNVLENKFFTWPGPKKLLFPLDILANIFIWFKSYPIFLMSNSVASISSHAKKDAQRLYFAKTKKIYWGASPTSLLTTNAKMYKNKKEITIVSVSRITPYKGFHKLVEAVNQLDTSLNIKLIICGSHPQKNYLNYLKKIATKRTQIILNASDTLLKKIYARGDIYATCDKYLFFGMPILEAASNGLPVVALNYAAAKEMVQHGKTGFIAQDTKELKKYLELLIKNKGLRTKFSKAAKEFARRFTWENTAKEYEKIFKKILEKKA